MTIPVQVRAQKAISRRERYQGYLPFAQMRRLAPLLAETGGELRVELDAGRDGEGAAWLRGRVAGSLKLTCQRGLHPFDWSCDLAVSLRLVADEAEEERLAHEVDPYLVRDDQLPLHDLVEDEVLLSMPMMPRCDDPNCIKRLK